MQPKSSTPKQLFRYRIACMFLYLGLSPIAFVFRFHRKSEFTHHHTTNAISATFLLISSIIGLIILVILTSLLEIHHEDIYSAIRVDILQDIYSAIPVIFLLRVVGIVIISTILLLSLFSLIHALCGKNKKLPILFRLSLKQWIPYATIILFLLALAAIIVTAVLAYHSVAITPRMNPNAKVYMLYDDVDFYPHWVFTLGFLPITLRTIEKSGPQSVCVCKLTSESMRQAFSTGKFIFLATHGVGYLITHEDGNGLISSGGRTYSPVYAKNVSGRNQPAFIYLTGCNASKDNNLWAESFPNSEVFSFDRYSAVLEHALWLYTDGPSKVEEILP